MYCDKCDKRIEAGGTDHWQVTLLKPLNDPREGRSHGVLDRLDVCEDCAFSMEDDRIGEIWIDYGRIA